MADTFDLVLRAEDAVTPKGIQALEIGVSVGTISEIHPIGVGTQAPHLAARRGKASSQRAVVSSSSKYQDVLASRPKSTERVAVQTVIEAVEPSGARAHTLHRSNGDVIEERLAARAQGVRVTVETCPHCLTLQRG